jgi:hypothetical protein
MIADNERDEVIIKNQLILIDPAVLIVVPPQKTTADPMMENMLVA